MAANFLLWFAIGVFFRGRRGVRELPVCAGGSVELLRGVPSVRSGQREADSSHVRHLGLPVSGASV